MVKISNQVKRYELWIERLRLAGLRDPKNPHRSIPPDDPRTKREIERLEIELSFLKGEINLEEYHKKYEDWKSKQN